MQTVADRPEAPTAIRTDLGAIFVSLELSRSTWLITSLSPDGGEKMSKHVVRGGDVAGLLERFAQLWEKTRARTGKVFPFVVIQEAGLDGFWIDRALQNEGIESHVVDPASIATSRRHRRAKTDRIDGEALVQDARLRFARHDLICSFDQRPKILGGAATTKSSIASRGLGRLNGGSLRLIVRKPPGLTSGFLVDSGYEDMRMYFTLLCSKLERTSMMLRVGK
jgi:hypothetical protein